MTSAAIFREPESRSAMLLSPTIHHRTMIAHSRSLFSLSPLSSLAFYNPITAKKTMVPSSTEPSTIIYPQATAVADAFAAAGLGGSPLAPAAAKLVQIHPRLRAPPIACPIIPIFHRQELGHQPEQPSAPTTAIISSIATNNIQLCLRTTPPSPTNASLNS
jgi:hypothetical protein